MKENKTTLYAIYKNGEHMGNERGKSIKEAIKKYLIASSYETFLNDKEFIFQYSGKKALLNTQYVSMLKKEEAKKNS